MTTTTWVLNDCTSNKAKKVVTCSHLPGSIRTQKEQAAFAERALQNECRLEEGDLLAYLIVHGANHAWQRLRWLLDVVLLKRDAIDWEQWCDRMQKMGVQRAVAQAFRLIAECFGMHLPTPVSRLIAAERETKNLVAYVFSVWQLADYGSVRQGMRTRSMLSNRLLVRYDDWRQLWNNPHQYLLWGRPDFLFPPNPVFTAGMQVRRMLFGDTER